MAAALNPSFDTIIEVAQRFLSGARRDDLAAEFGCSRRTIGKWLLKAGVVEQPRAVCRLDSRECVCGESFTPTNWRQGMCVTCIPTKAARHRHRRYGVTQPQYDAMMAEQDGLCLLCVCKFVSEFETCVDHDHETGRVRGLLCRGCNMVVARFEQPEFVARVKSYLQATLA